MTFPSPWVALVLAAASYRLWVLLAEDEILDRPRRWIVRLDRDWEEGKNLPENYRYGLASFINCAWCSGFWISIGVWLIWQLDEHWAEILAIPFAISAFVGVVRSFVDDEE